MSSRKEKEEVERQFKQITPGLEAETRAYEARMPKPTKIPTEGREALIFTGITKALGYALKTSVRDHTEQRLVVQEFWHSLNRKGIIRNELVQELINLTYKEL